MAWKQISECLPAWLSAQIKKGAEADNGPGQVLWRNVSTESGGESAPVTTQPGKAPASSAEGRGRATHSKAPPQRRVARPMLSVIEGGGGRPAGSGGLSRAAYRAATGEGNRVREFLKLVVGGSGH